jgi:hypothetical protein
MGQQNSIYGKTIPCPILGYSDFSIEKCIGGIGVHKNKTERIP